MDQSRGSNVRDLRSVSASLLPALVIIAGFILRIIPATRLFLNPDEALHNLLASQSSFAQAWKAALTNAHPPLLILVLYYWRSLGHSELWLRLPSVLAGTAACWFFYAWLKLIVDRSTARTGLLLFAFAPSLILLSAEIRQYALLFFFDTICLYFSERALQHHSAGDMAWFSLALYGALLTHYSALLFAFAMGIYVLLRLYPHGRLRLALVWAAGQMVGIAIAAYFLLTHLPKLRQTGIVRADLESYLRRAVYQPGTRNPVAFIAAQTLRVFTYLLSHGLIGTLVLISFLVGTAWLLKSKQSGDRPESQTSLRQLALLLLLPFVVNWVVSLAGLYPLGATRHNSFLAPFALAGASIGISRIPGRDWIKLLVVVLALSVCNLFPAPPPPIRAKDQSKALMQQAVAYTRSTVPPESVFLTDYESGLLLGYYLCGHGVVQIFPPQKPLAVAECRDYRVLATSFLDWKFTAKNFSAEMTAADQMATPGKEIWLFYAGWINDSESALKQELKDYGCPSPQTFGENIVVCRVSVSARPNSAR
ncbi:MAG TPA: glycosyltransferase family 39 protein [Verrucomicrobiae bacterium]|nr:glycosyltransferase family 39 protein [Verrucomicrobiae bacterium]